MTINTASQSEADAPVKRGRGWPPGSKNKPKPQPEAQAKLAKPDTSTVLPATPSIETTDLQSVPDILPPRRLTDDEYLDQAEGEIRG